MSYTPNFSDPRTRARVKKSIGFAAGVFSPVKSASWSTRYIDKWFGCNSNDLGNYIRNQLLIVTDDSYSKDKNQCKEYILNTQGIDYLKQQMGMSTQPTSRIVLQAGTDEYKQELDTGAFVYNDKSSRLWHPLQNFRRESKRNILENSGFNYHYDIQCCAFTLIHQYSQQIPEVLEDYQMRSQTRKKWKQGPMDLYLFAMREYLHDRQKIRDEIAQATEVDSDSIKSLLNALLAGAKLSTSPKSDIFKMFDGDKARIQFLQQHEFLNQLREDIKTCWDYIAPTLPRRSKQDKNKKERMLGISSKQKWGVYFDLERRVLNEVRDFLSESNNKHFLEHDGWSCANEIDQLALKQRIYANTGFQIEFELK